MFRDTRKTLWMILALSVLLRLGAAFVLGDQVIELPGTADQLSYHTLANRLIEGYGFTFGTGWWPATPAGAPTAHWSFFYTFFLAAVYSIFGPHPLAARIIQAIIIGILHPSLAYLLGARLFSKRVGLISAFCTAIYAYFIYYAATLMTEPFFISSVLGILFIAVWLVDVLTGENPNNKRLAAIGLGLGLLIGIAMMLRQLILLFVPFLYLWIAWAAYRGKALKKVVMPLVISVCVIATMILPFSLFNASRFGHFVLLNTNAGFAFFWGNNPFYGTQFIPILSNEQYLAMIPPELKSLDEAALDSALLKLGLQYVFSHPKEYLLLSLSRIPIYFSFLPSADSGLVSNLTRVASFGIFWPFMLAGLVISITQLSWKKLDFLHSPAFLPIFFAFFYSLIHIMTWTLIRYRLPVDAVLLIFSSLAISEIVQLIRRRTGILHRV